MSIGGDADNDGSSTLSVVAVVIAATDVTVDGGANVKNKMMTYDMKSSAVLVERSSLFRKQYRRRRTRLKLQLAVVVILSFVRRRR
jgi:uncharacterized membrane protein YoaK (UPF0700 family)